jgi:hypothetical protein
MPGKHIRTRARAGAAVTAAVVIASLAWATPANAWWTDTQVDLNGNASCHAEHADMVNISLDNGEVGAALTNNYGMYFMSFFRISAGGTGGTAYTRAASDRSWCSRRIKVTRPFSGTTQYLVLNM